jgi:hypothetical protein
MAKWVAAQVLDGALNIVAGASRMVATAGPPADYVAAIAGQLAAAAMMANDFSLADGAGAGRKVTIASKPAVPIVSSGTADHVALLDEAGARLLYVTTCPPQELLAGGTVNFGQWSVEIGAPA